MWCHMATVKGSIGRASGASVAPDKGSISLYIYITLCHVAIDNVRVDLVNSLF